MKKKILVIAFLLTMITGCQNKDFNINFNIDGNESNEFNNSEYPEVAMQIEKYGTIIIELYPDVAPNTVNNFIYLVRTGFYDNNSFHRLVKGFVLQGGDPEGKGTGGPGYHIQGEFSSNNFKNDLKHTKGIVSMARSQLPNSAGSQFFIMLDDNSSLDGNYAAFGKVIKGMENIEKIEKYEEVINDQTGKLNNNIRIKKALVNTKGIDHQEPEKN